jgi:hypothetical protein
MARKSGIERTSQGSFHPLIRYCHRAIGSLVGAKGGDAMNMGTSWAEIAAALAVMGIITFLLLV